MATRKNAATLAIVDESTVDEFDTQETAEWKTGTAVSELDMLRAQAKQIAAQIKLAKEALPKQTPLERVVARQQTVANYLLTGLSGLILARVKAGQDREDATNAVIDFCFFGETKQ